jgi:hypothetical protein
MAGVLSTLCKSLSGKSRIAWATPLSMLLFSALIGTLFVNSAAAFTIPPQTMKLTVQSPESKVHIQNSIPVEFTVSNFTVPSCNLNDFFGIFVIMDSLLSWTVRR